MKPRKITFSLLTIALLFTNLFFSTVAFATDSSSLSESEVQNAIETYEFLQTEDTGQYVNDMQVKQEVILASIQEEVEEAEKKGERTYTLSEILELTPEDLDISSEDLSSIQSMVRSEIAELTDIINGFSKAGEEEHEIVQNIKNHLETFKVKESQIKIEEPSHSDGTISGGGFPYCLDDNGWGPYSFLGSDCYSALWRFWNCAFDSTLGKMDSSLRYCKAYINNCSPLIGHKSTWHTH